MARLVALGALFLLLAVLVAGCGVGSADEGKISDAADTYLRSLAAGDTAAACGQLTAAARAGLDGGCEAALRRIAARVGSDRLEAAADAGMDIDVDGTTGSAVVHDLDARFTLVAVGDDWRISTGAAAPAMWGQGSTAEPAEPVSSPAHRPPLQESR